MPITIGSKFETKDPYKYGLGISSYQQTEALEGAVPRTQNSPQKCPYGLYAEKLSGTAFTAPRGENKQTWFYRTIPSACHTPLEPMHSKVDYKPDNLLNVPRQLRWSPFDMDNKGTFIDGLRFMGGAGDPRLKHGLGIFLYTAAKDMGKEAFYSGDGDMLIVPQTGDLDIQTEHGKLYVRPKEIVVIPRGVRFRVRLPQQQARGYILETYTGHFELPELGPIGSNCLANDRDFEVPVACYEDIEEEHRLVAKYNGQFFQAKISHSPFNVVGWHGLYYPYKYDLGKFNVIGSVSFDHPDPSIYTVLTVKSDHPGTAIADFVIFAPRYLVQEDTFRPPWYHRNTMSEWMGLICGDYDAKKGGGFQPGGASLHNVMGSHGPDADTFHEASNGQLSPKVVSEGSIAFMFESSMMIGVSPWAWQEVHHKVQEEYNHETWLPLKKHFSGPPSGSA